MPESEAEVLARFAGRVVPGGGATKPRRPSTDDEEQAHDIGRRAIPLPSKPEQPARRKRTPTRDLARLVESCRSAPIVWIALGEIAAAQKRRRFGVTRDELAKRTGILRLPAITRALAVLEAADWIQRVPHAPERRDAAADQAGQNPAKPGPCARTEETAR